MAQAFAGSYIGPVKKSKFANRDDPHLKTKQSVSLAYREKK